MILRTYWLATWMIGIIVALAAAGSVHAAPTLTVADVTTIIQQAVKAVPPGLNAVIAVSDREGFILGVYGVNGAPSLATTGLAEVNAIDKAGTAAFLSSNGEAFTSRTAGFIIQPHFPPGIINTSPGPLTGVGLSSLPFSDINHFRNPNPALQGQGILNTSLSGNPGGVPLYKNGVLVGGVGVDSNTILSALVYDGSGNVDEDIAVEGQTGYSPPPGILATEVLLNGLRLPYTSFSGNVAPPLAPLVAGNFDPAFPATASPGAPFQAGLAPYNANPATQTAIPITPIPAPLNTIAGGEVRDPIIDSPLLASPVAGQLRLNHTEVAQILYQGAMRAFETRGAIRNPIGPAEVFIVVIDYYATDGAGTPLPYAPPVIAPPKTPFPFPRPGVLGSFRTSDATIFSYDVAAQKARTALFFSNNTMALSARGVGFLAQGTYPPGIDGTTYGPYGPPTYGPSNPNFLLGPATNPLFAGPFGIQTAVSVNPLSAAAIPLTPINPFLINGITVFPGGYPLYRNGVLIGAVGVSGDGVDQDDIIGASATVGFEAPTAIRSDQFSFRGARLPYAKFPQNSSL
jgi:uncharacterized protein GlcG (DUF336 family)